MSNIQERLDSLQPHIKGIRYVQGVQVVDAVFKNGWTIPESDVIKKDLIEEEGNYYVFYTEKEGVTFDDLLEYIEGIISINIEREKKNELFKTKVKELQEIFKSNTLSKLKLFKFKFDEPDLMTSLNNINIDSDNVVNDIKEEVETTEEVEKEIKEEVVVENITITKKVKNQEIELPPKKEKIELQEFKEPNIVCKCGKDEVCIACAE
jgi:hypothetical protein